MGVWDEHNQHLRLAVIRAVDTLIKTTDARPSMTRVEFEALVTLLVQQYGQVAVSSALIALESGRLEAGMRGLPAPVPAEPVNIEQTRATASWAINKADGDLPVAARRLAGPVGRMVRQAARDTVWESTRVAGTGYVRVPGPRACAFCLMLASRGAVYAKDTVLAVGKKAKRPEGARYHDNCSCGAREVLSDDDIPQIVKDLEAEWYEVTYTGRGPVADQKKAWQKYVQKKHRAMWRPASYTSLDRATPVGQARGYRRQQPSLASILKNTRGVGQWDEGASKQQKEDRAAEKRIAQWLLEAGATTVQQVHEADRTMPDFLVDGNTPIEAKRVVSSTSIQKQARRGLKQASHIVMDARESRMALTEAQEGMRAAIRNYGGDIDRITVIGNDFVLSWP